MTPTARPPEVVHVVAAVRAPAADAPRTSVSLGHLQGFTFVHRPDGAFVASRGGMSGAGWTPDEAVDDLGWRSVLEAAAVGGRRPATGCVSTTTDTSAG